jgi:hypothetical protein
MAEKTLIVTEEEELDYRLSRLQTACVGYLAKAVPYQLQTLPFDVGNLALGFDDYQLTLTHYRCDHKGTYFEYVYAPVRTPTLEHKTVISPDSGEAVAIVVWREVLWVPVEARIGFQSSEEPARPVSQEDIEEYAAR